MLPSWVADWNLRLPQRIKKGPAAAAALDTFGLYQSISRCLPHLHRLVTCRIRTREACRPVSVMPPPPSLREDGRLQDRLAGRTGATDRRTQGLSRARPNWVITRDLPRPATLVSRSLVFVTPPNTRQGIIVLIPTYGGSSLQPLCRSLEYLGVLRGTGDVGVRLLNDPVKDTLLPPSLD